VSQGGDALGDRPDPSKPQGIDRQTPQLGQDLDAVELAVAVGIFSQRHIPDLVPAVFDGPTLPDCSEQGLWSSPQGRDVVTALFLWLSF